MTRKRHERRAEEFLFGFGAFLNEKRQRLLELFMAFDLINISVDSGKIRDDDLSDW
jgi:hypothetical protein